MRLVRLDEIGLQDVRQSQDQPVDPFAERLRLAGMHRVPGMDEDADRRLGVAVDHLAVDIQRLADFVQLADQFGPPALVTG